MIDTVKKTLLAGLGAVIVSKDAVEGALHDWIEKGKITPGEAKLFAEKLIQAGENQWGKSMEDVSQKLADFAQRVPFAKQDELRSLEARVALLEQVALRAALAVGTQGSPPPSTEP